MSQWNENVVFKAMEYYQTEKVKQMKCDEDFMEPEQYDMEANTRISLDNICCIILYCDMTGLCTHFSGSFRKKNEFETLGALKRRHQKNSN
eukprot:191267_1